MTPSPQGERQGILERRSLEPPPPRLDLGNARAEDTAESRSSFTLVSQRGSPALLPLVPPRPAAGRLPGSQLVFCPSSARLCASASQAAVASLRRSAPSVGCSPAGRYSLHSSYTRIEYEEEKPHRGTFRET